VKTAYDDTEHGGVYICPEGIGLGRLYIKNTGEINAGGNFLVDSVGNVTLTGNITWGEGASPTQTVYAGTALAKPADNTTWNTFPFTSTDAWHTTYAEDTDYYASYTYDGGHTWTDAVQIRGKDGDTVRVASWYYLSSSSTPPASPSDIPTGWTSSPKGVSSAYPYEYISQCTVTNEAYSTWSTPVLFANYADVNDENVFNALTGSGEKFGCFVGNDGKLYINAEYLQSGTVKADLTCTGKLEATNAVISGNVTATSGTIGGWAMEEGVLHSSEGAYGTYSYSSTGTDLLTVTGYAFTVLYKDGIHYYVKASNQWSDTTLVDIHTTTGRKV
jgi:hypothetical protein